MLVLDYLQEKWHDAFLGTLVADALGARFGDPARERLTLGRVPEDAGEIYGRHGGVTWGSWLVM